MKRYNSSEGEVIKLSLCNIKEFGLSSKDVLEQSDVWFREKYETSQSCIRGYFKFNGNKDDT